MPSSTPFSASAEPTSCQAKTLESSSFSLISSPAVIRLPPLEAPLSLLTRATGSLSSLPYGSQNEHRYRAP